MDDRTYAEQITKDEKRLLEYKRRRVKTRSDILDMQKRLLSPKGLKPHVSGKRRSAR